MRITMQTCIMHMTKIRKKSRFLDSTLREGEQHPGCFVYKQTENTDCMDVRLFWR